jgi:hypothetical protein
MVWGRADGLAIGEDDDSPREAAEREGWDILDTYTDGQVLARHEGTHYLVEDVNGPWAIEVSNGAH